MAIANALVLEDAEMLSTVWGVFSEELKGCIGIFSLSGGQMIGRGRPPAERKFGDHGLLFPVFDPANLSVYSAASNVTHLNRQPGTISVDYSVSIDTNFASFLRCMELGKPTSLGNAPLEALIYLRENQFNFDAVPYYFENMGKGFIENPAFAETVSAIAAVPYLHPASLKIGHWKVPKVSRGKVKSRTKSVLRRFRKDGDFQDLLAGTGGLQKMMNAYLLKAYICTRTLSDVAARREALFEFAHRELGCISPVGLNVCLEILTNGKKSRFTQKIAAAPNKALKTILSSAWDIALMETLIRISVIQSYHSKRLFLPYLLSFDSPWHEMLRSFRCSGMVMNIDTGRYHVFQPFILKLSEDASLQRYYTIEARRERRPLMDELRTVPTKLDAIIDQLQQTVRGLPSEIGG